MVEKACDLKELFLKNFSRGLLVTFHDASWRKTGKTTLLIKTSLKHRMPIIVKSQGLVDYIKDLNQDVEVYHINHSELRTRSLSEVLVDEGLEAEDLHSLRRKGIKVRGGFFRI